MVFTVVFYGRLRKMFGNEITISREIGTIKELIEHLVSRNKNITNFYDSLIFSINHKNATIKSTIQNGDIVSIFFTPTGG